MYDFESQIVDIPDYPEPGVVFKDITPLFGNPEALKAMVDALAEHFADMGITKVVGPEARGFMVGVPVAVALGAGFVPARKPWQTAAQDGKRELRARVWNGFYRDPRRCHQL